MSEKEDVKKAVELLAAIGMTRHKQLCKEISKATKRGTTATYQEGRDLMSKLSRLHTAVTKLTIFEQIEAGQF